MKWCSIEIGSKSSFASFMSLKYLSFVTMKLGEVTKIKDNNNIKNTGKQWKDYFI